MLLDGRLVVGKHVFQFDVRVGDVTLLCDGVGEVVVENLDEFGRGHFVSSQ